MKRTAVALVSVALAAGTASAEQKSLRTARVLSGVGTGVSSALFVTAFFVGEKDGDVNMPLLYTGLGTGVITPALGEMYAGTYVTFGMGLRLAAGALAVYAVLGQSQTTRCSTTVEFTECRGLKQEAYMLLGIAGIAFVGGAAYDIKELPKYIDERNRTFSLAPTLLPTRDGEPAYGLAAVGTF